MKIDMKVNITDIIFYSVILVMLIFYLKVTLERVETQKVNIELRMRDCKIPEELIPSITKEMIKGNYETINNLTEYEDPNNELINNFNFIAYNDTYE